MDARFLVIAMNGNLYALDRETGAVVWQNNLEGGGLGAVAIAIAKGLVIASAHGSRIFAVDYETGASRWSQDTQARGRATILVDGERIVCVKDGYVDAFDFDGQVVWAQPLRGAGEGPATLGLPGNVVQADTTHHR